MRHGQAMESCMCKLWAECVVYPDWKINKPLSRPQFRSVMSTKMYQYWTEYWLYPGVEFICSNTRIQQKIQALTDFGCEANLDGTRFDTYNQFLDAKMPCKVITLLCTDDLDFLKNI